MLLLPAEHSPLVLKLLISGKSNNSGSKRKKCDQNEKDADFCECVREHERIEQSFGKSGGLHKWKGVTVKNQRQWLGGGYFNQFKQSLT